MTFADLFGARLKARSPPKPIFLTPEIARETRALSFALWLVRVRPIFRHEKVRQTRGGTAKIHFILAGKAIIQLFFGSFD